MARKFRGVAFALAGVLGVTGAVVGAASPAYAAPVVLRVATVHETTGQNRLDALVRMPMVLDADETVDPASIQVVRAGTSTVVPSQLGDTRLDGSGRLVAADVYVVDDVAASATARYDILGGATPASAAPMTITDTANALTVSGGDVDITFSKSGATPGTITALTSGSVPVTLAGGMGPTATLRVESLENAAVNADVEVGTNGAPQKWTGSGSLGDEVLSWAADAYASGDRSLAIDTRGSGQGEPVLHPDARLVDFAGPGYAETGTWSNSSQAGYAHPTHRISKTLGATATWTPQGLAAGAYDVYVWVPSTGSSNSANPAAAVYTVTTASGPVDVTVDQRVSTGTFRLIGSWTLGAQTAVKLTVGQTINHRADAVLFQPAGVPIDTGADVPRGAWTSDPVSVVAGERFFVRAWGKSAGVAAPSQAATTVTFTNAQGAAVGTPQSLGAFTAAAWTPLSKSVTVPAGATQMVIENALEGSGQAWFDNLTVYRSAGTTAPMAGTSATQRNVSVTAQPGPLVTTVSIVNQLMRSGTPQPAYQLVTYRIPNAGTTIEQVVQYRGTAAVEESTAAVEATSRKLLVGQLGLGANGTTGDVVTTTSAARNPAADDPNVAPVVVDTGSGAALVVSGSSMDTVSAVTTGSTLTVTGPTRTETGPSAFAYRLFREDRTWSRLSLIADTAASGIHQQFMRDTNPLVASVDNPAVTVENDLEPLLVELNDVILDTTDGKLSSSSWSGRALAAYVNWEITGDASYKTRGDTIVNQNITPQKLTVQYHVDQIQAGGGILDEHTMKIPMLFHYNPDPRLSQYANAVGQAAINTLGFVDDYGHNAMATSLNDFGSLANRAGIKNMQLFAGATYVWGMRKEGNTAGLAWLEDAFASPRYSQWAGQAETAYTALSQGQYLPVKGDAQAYYTAAVADLMPQVERGSDGLIAFDKGGKYALYASLMVDDNALGGDASGWPQTDYLQTHYHRAGWSPLGFHFIAAAMFDGDGVEGATTAVRLLEGYLALTRESVSNDSGVQMLPGVTDPDYGRRFNLNWYGTDGLTREVNPGIAISNGMVMNGLWFNHVHPDGLD